VSNIYPFDDRETIATEARAWLIRLDADTPLSPAEDSALREWANRSPAHREELQRLSAFWNDANILTELAIPLSIQSSTRRSWGRLSALLGTFTRPRLGIAASMIGVAIVLALWLYPQPQGAVNGIYGTAIGEQKITQLPDGSTIHLNTDSQVQVDYSTTTRKLRLLRGEAHFQVAKDPRRPFEVHAAKNLVKAIGTAFSVQLRDSRMKVIVTEGKVGLATQIDNLDTTPTDIPNASANRNPTEDNSIQPKLLRLGTLSRGQSTTYDSTTLTRQEISPNDVMTAHLNIETIAEEDLKRQLAWRDGYLVFKGDTLAEVIEEVTRYTPVSIEITDSSLKQIPIGGRFKAGDLEALYEVLEISFGVQVSQLDDQHVQLKLPSG